MHRDRHILEQKGKETGDSNESDQVCTIRRTLRERERTGTGRIVLQFGRGVEMSDEDEDEGCEYE